MEMLLTAQRLRRLGQLSVTCTSVLFSMFMGMPVEDAQAMPNNTTAIFPLRVSVSGCAVTDKSANVTITGGASPQVATIAIDDSGNGLSAVNYEVPHTLLSSVTPVGASGFCSPSGNPVTPIVLSTSNTVPFAQDALEADRATSTEGALGIDTSMGELFDYTGLSGLESDLALFDPMGGASVLDSIEDDFAALAMAAQGINYTGTGMAQMGLTAAGAVAAIDADIQGNDTNIQTNITNIAANTALLADVDNGAGTVSVEQFYDNLFDTFPQLPGTMSGTSAISFANETISELGTLDGRLDAIDGGTALANTLPTLLGAPAITGGGFIYDTINSVNALPRTVEGAIQAIDVDVTDTISIIGAAPYNGTGPITGFSFNSLENSVAMNQTVADVFNIISNDNMVLLNMFGANAINDEGFDYKTFTNVNLQSALNEIDGDISDLGATDVLLDGRIDDNETRLDDILLPDGDAIGDDSGLLPDIYDATAPGGPTGILQDQIDRFDDFVPTPAGADPDSLETLFGDLSETVNTTLFTMGEIDDPFVDLNGDPIVGVNTILGTFDFRLDDLENVFNAVNNVASQVTTNSNTNTTQQTAIDGNTARLTALDGGSASSVSIADITGRLDVLRNVGGTAGLVVDNGTAITALQGRLGTFVPSMALPGSLEAFASDIQTRVDDLLTVMGTGRVPTLEGRLDNFNGAPAMTVEAVVTALDSRVGANEMAVSSNDTDIANLEAADTFLATMISFNSSRLGNPLGAGAPTGADTIESILGAYFGIDNDGLSFDSVTGFTPLGNGQLALQSVVDLVVNDFDALNTVLGVFPSASPGTLNYTNLMSMTSNAIADVVGAIQGDVGALDGRVMTLESGQMNAVDRLDEFSSSAITAAGLENLPAVGTDTFENVFTSLHQRVADIFFDPDGAGPTDPVGILATVSTTATAADTRSTTNESAITALTSGSTTTISEIDASLMSVNGELDGIDTRLDIFNTGIVAGTSVEAVVNTAIARLNDVNSSGDNLEAVEGRLAAAEGRLADVNSSGQTLEAFEGRVTTLVDVTGAVGRVPTLEGRLDNVDASGETLEAFEDRVTTLVDTAGTTGRVPTLEGRLDDVNSSTENIEAVETRLTSLINVAGDAGRVFDLEGRLNDVNMSTETLEMIEDRLTSLINVAGDAGRVFDIEGRLNDVDGSGFDLEGVEDRVTANATDISAQELRLDSIDDTMGNGVIPTLLTTTIPDLDTRITTNTNDIATINNTTVPALQAEIDSDVAAATTALQAEIDSDVAAATTALQAEIDADVAAATMALQAEIDADVAAATTALQMEIDSDVAAATMALQAEIDADVAAATMALQAEIDADVAAATMALQAEIDSDVAAATTALQMEIDGDVAAATMLLQAEIDSDVDAATMLLQAEIDSDVDAATMLLQAEIDSDVDAATMLLQAEIDSDVDAATMALQAEIDADVAALAMGAVQSNTDAIALINGTTLPDAITALQAEIDGDVAALAAGDVATNTASIATNRTNVQANTAAIGTNAANIASASDDVIAATAAITAQQASINANSESLNAVIARLDAAEADRADLRSRIERETRRNRTTRRNQNRIRTALRRAGIRVRLIRDEEGDE